MKIVFQNRQQLSSKLRYLIILILAVGIFFRFINLDQKIYWIDETFTSLRLSGYTETQVVQELSSAGIVNIKSLQKYQHLHAQKTVIDTIKGVAKEEPQLTPLYFIIARFWAQTFGSSIAALRCLSAIISLLIFPALYWLGLELFQSAFISSIAVSLMAVSPFHILYAQEARPYSLWTLLIIISSASFLQAMRLKTSRCWAIYCLTVSLGFYCHLFFAFPTIVHIIYALVQEKLKLTKNLQKFALSLTTALLTLTPWAIILFSHAAQVVNKTDWQSKRIAEPYKAFFKTWLINFNLPFFDFDYLDSVQFESNYFGVLLVGCGFLGIVYALYYTYQHSPPKTWQFILLLSLAPLLILISADILLGGMRSTVSRYLIPSYLGFQLAVAYFLGDKLLKSCQQNLAKIMLITVLTLGIISSNCATFAPFWWFKYSSNYNYQLAQVMNKAQQPLLISELTSELIDFQKLGNLLSLSYLLQKKVKISVILQPQMPIFSQKFEVFCYNPSPVLEELLTQQAKIESILTYGKDDIKILKIHLP